MLSPPATVVGNLNSNVCLDEAGSPTGFVLNFKLLCFKDMYYMLLYGKLVQIWYCIILAIHYIPSYCMIFIDISL